MTNREEGRRATYLGPRHPALPGKNYPSIETGAKGLVTPRHRSDAERDPAHPLCFWPNAWGHIYFFPVAENEVTIMIEDTREG